MNCEKSNILIKNNINNFNELMISDVKKISSNDTIDVIKSKRLLVQNYNHAEQIITKIIAETN